MKYLKPPLFSPTHHLGMDEFTLATAEERQTGFFRVWEPSTLFVVLGRGSKVDVEVNREVCATDNIPILRRTSGGATVVGGPGCLMYTVVLPHVDDPQLATIDATHQFMLQKTATGLNATLKDERNLGELQMAGTSDLAWKPSDANQSTELCKVSGNSMRRGRTCTLYHGTLLYEFDLDLISRYLSVAPRQPEYRQGRDHRRFVTNLPLSRHQIVSALESAWGVSTPETPSESMLAQVEELVRTKYSQDSWNFRH